MGGNNEQKPTQSEHAEPATPAILQWAEKHPWLALLLPPLVVSIIFSTVVELQLGPGARGLGIALGIIAVFPLTTSLWLYLMRHWPEDWRKWWTANGTIILIGVAYWWGRTRQSADQIPGQPNESVTWFDTIVGAVMVVLFGLMGLWLLGSAVVFVLSKLGIGVP